MALPKKKPWQRISNKDNLPQSLFGSPKSLAGSFVFHFGFEIGGTRKTCGRTEEKTNTTQTAGGKHLIGCTIEMKRAIQRAQLLRLQLAVTVHQRNENQIKSTETN